MGAILSIDVDSAEVEDFFAGVTARAAAPQEVLGYMGQDMVVKFKANIDAESGGPDFPAWVDLKEATVKERERLGYGGEHPMLQRTEDLYSHFAFNVTGPETVAAGTDGELEYPAVHDLGEGDMPQRSFVWIDDPLVDGWLEVIAQFLVDGTPPPVPVGS